MNKAILEVLCIKNTLWMALYYLTCLPIGPFLVKEHYFIHLPFFLLTFSFILFALVWVDGYFAPCRSDVEEGGETVFPAAEGNFSANPEWKNLSACAKRGLHVKPKMGDALLFWSMRPDATLDPSSLHGMVLWNSTFFCIYFEK